LWKQGYGNGRQINWLFVALARAAGLEAYAVYISARSEYFFNPKLMNTNQLNGDVVLVKVNGKDVYCDPATRFAPFGLLSWPETGVQGLKLDKDGRQLGDDNTAGKLRFADRAKSGFEVDRHGFAGR